MDIGRPLRFRDYVSGCALFVLVILVLVVVLSIKTVSPGQAAVVTAFGQLQGVRKDGVHLALFQGFTYYELRTKKVEVHTEAGSKNGQFVYVDTATTYNLKTDNLDLLFSEVGDQEQLEIKFIRPVINDVVYQATAQYTADEILPKQAEFRDLIIKTLKDRLNQKYFEFVDLQIVDIDFSEQYNLTLEQKQIAEQNAVKEKQVAEQNVQKQKLENEKNLLQKNFELEAAKIDSEKQRLLQQSLTTELLQKMWVEKWNGVLPTTITGDNSLLSLPIK